MIKVVKAMMEIAMKILTFKKAKVTPTAKASIDVAIARGYHDFR